MKKLLGIVVLGLLLSGNGYASNFFKYDQVLACGPKKISTLDDVPNYEGWEYYYVHVAIGGHVIVFNDGYEYSTLNKKEYSQLWIQNHKITSATLRIDEITNVYQFEMISKYDPSYPIDHKKMIEFFNLSIESMTFVSRRVGYTPKKRYESSTGICWKVAGSTK